MFWFIPGWYLCVGFAMLASNALARSVSHGRLLRIEPVTHVRFDIAPRPELFFQKRYISKNPAAFPVRPHSIEYDDMLRLTWTAYNQTFRLHLWPNTELLHPEAVLSVGDKQERIRPEDHRLYRGYAVDESHTDARWLADTLGLMEEHGVDRETGTLGWARILVRHDVKHSLDYPLFEGSFYVHGDMYHVKMVHNYRLTKRATDPDLLPDHGDPHMVIYRDSDVIPDSPGHHGSDINYEHCNSEHALPHQDKVLGKPQWGVFSGSQLDTFPFIPHRLTKRAPSGCPTARKVLYMGAAADCTYTKYYQSESNARAQILKDWSLASAVYESTFNIQLGLVNITIMPETCPSTPSKSTPWNRGCSTAYTIDNRLSDFSRWRGTLGDDGAGLWHLMTSCASGVEIGVAWVSTLCLQEVHNSGDGRVISGAGVSSITRDEWKVVAHEIGHNFGARHDCTADACSVSGGTSNCCPLGPTECDSKGAYLMNPSSNSSSKSFSPCSIQEICSSVHSIGSCLQDPGTRTITTAQMCGNGIKESGEDCDPGGVDNACCDAKTCKFKANAKCDDAKDLCCLNCQIQNATHVCRPAASECDIEEKCTGNSGDCPKDSYKPDGDACGNGLQCASGQCTSRDEQCRARASAMGITKACSADVSCQILCDNPSSLGCFVFNGFFVDGTPCGVGGSCKAGSCSMENFGNNAKNWLENHMQIAIPVGIVLGLVLLFCIARIIFYGCCGHGGRQKTHTNAPSAFSLRASAPPPPPYQPHSYPPPPPTSQGYGGELRPAHWVDPAAYNAFPSSTPSTAPTRNHSAGARA